MGIRTCNINIAQEIYLTVLFDFREGNGRKAILICFIKRSRQSEREQNSGDFPRSIHYVAVMLMNCGQMLGIRCLLMHVNEGEIRHFPFFEGKIRNFPPSQGN